MSAQPRICIICDFGDVFARDRCHACLKYLYRHGKDRTEKLIVAHGRRVIASRYARREGMV